MAGQHLGGDTICAIASGTGGAVGIVRISGPRAEAVLRRVVPALPSPLASHRLHLGEAVDPASREPLDEVLACIMRAPHSYTGETVAEVHGHGGAANLGRLLEAAVRGGARIAQPGEFTRRAFVAGRIDLARAEAVAEVIAAGSERALRVAQAQRRGSISQAVAGLRERLVSALADVEARVDFPDERLDVRAPEELAEALASIAGDAGSLASSHQRGRLLVEGLDVVLVGRANAGKSSLLNALAGEERALVDAAPGTTRDFIEVEVALAGLRAVVTDTAGEREDEQTVALERRGVALGRRRRERADVVVLVVDGTEGFGAVEERLLVEARGAASAPVPVLVAWNKWDRAPAVVGVPTGVTWVTTVATTGAGVAELGVAIARAAGDAGDDAVATVTRARQRELLAEAAEACARATDLVTRSAPPELAAVDLRVALDRLGQVTGETFDEAVLDRIFARFCIGK